MYLGIASSKAAAAALAALAMTMATAGSALAAAPVITTTPFHQTIVDAQTCAFANTQVYTGTVRMIAFADGTVKQHLTLVGTISAHGKSLTDTDHYTVTSSADGAARIVGTVIHIVLPGGGVVVDAGKITISPTGQLAFTGRQDQLTGNLAGFCAALS
jgi:hypothetical protein